MRDVIDAIRRWGEQVWRQWNAFWFTPTSPRTLASIRVLAGGMLFYTHLVWSLDLDAFLGRDSWITADVARRMTSPYTWSYLFHVDSPAVLWVLHLSALVVLALFTVGYQTRVVSVLAWVITLSYCHRLQGALFGLDQVNAMLATYLMIGPSGAVYSVDRLLARRRARGKVEPPAESVTANLAIRLIQVHMCVIYLFGGIGKMRGEMWWDGSALWYAIYNHEYQSIDATWLSVSPWLIAALTHVTVFWETFYCVLIWPRLTRPVMLTLAVLMHGGICLFLGMITFGAAMIIGNLAFVSPETVEWAVERCRRPFSVSAGQGRAAPSPVAARRRAARKPR